MKYTRREFLKTTSNTLIVTSLAKSGWSVSEKEMPQREFGKTGEKASLLGLGGHHIGQIRDDRESIALIREAIDLGVTFMDNAWEYHNGRSEELMGRALQDGYREKVFLMTKHHGRDRKTAMQHLEDSLRRLKTDVIDLWQFHEVVYDEDPRMIFAKDGGIEAAEEAKKQGKVRYIGFTGHKNPDHFKAMLNYDFQWDAVQMPLNVLDAHFRSFEKNILPILTERGIAPLAMKTLASGFLLKAGVVKPEEALRYSLSLPIATAISGMQNREVLHKNVEIVKNFEPLSEEEKQEILNKTRQVAQAGEFEPFKTTRMFDGSVGRKLHGVG
ncbi:MAG: aldo/keto reductase [bacterium]|jgi:aryl-alcohol dehydrogenase-like predicted oxidoreductase